ncbi:MAG: M23 family peptidase [Rhodospirillaceae bacterium]|jgi:hypothetical protein|nr:M23 family peptidase [Rhodospirillaceae bacterium]
MKPLATGLFAAMLAVAPAICAAADDPKGHGGVATGLVPVYPEGRDCPVLTSLYGDWIDLDGRRRDRSHEGVDGGRFGDAVVAPAGGRVLAIWPVTTEIGADWSVLILHDPADLGLGDPAISYYSEFDHLAAEDIAHLRAGARIGRGDRIGTVRHPGGNPAFRAEVHWEVYELPTAAQDALTWSERDGVRQGWWNEAATLVDPLYGLGLDRDDPAPGQVAITPAQDAMRLGFRGFSYHLECR